jgi:hypothetical protein
MSIPLRVKFSIAIFRPANTHDNSAEFFISGAAPFHQRRLCEILLLALGRLFSTA